MPYTTITASDDTYPSLLAQIPDPPDNLYVRGSLEIADRVVVAVVGSRKASSYGREVIHRIVEPLARAGLVIVSGLAHGIDAAAHQATLAAGGMTVAVLGTPIDKIYPAVHESLARKIIEHGGAILAEAPPGSPTFKTSFPKRNRIIAGMSHATIVVEASLRSGSLITARLALEDNREVFAVPGPITSETSAGTNLLIKHGAHPLTDAQDVFDVLGLTVKEAQSPTPSDLTESELRVIEYLDAVDPVHIDKLAESVTIDLPDLQNLLTLLEIRGVIRMSSPGQYIRIR